MRINYILILHYINVIAWFGICFVISSSWIELASQYPTCRNFEPFWLQKKCPSPIPNQSIVVNSGIWPSSCPRQIPGQFWLKQVSSLVFIPQWNKYTMLCTQLFKISRGYWQASVLPSAINIYSRSWIITSRIS